MPGRIRTALRRWVYPRDPRVLRVRDTNGDYHELAVACVHSGDQVRVALRIDEHPPVLLLPLQVGTVRGALKSNLAAALAHQQKMP